MAEGEASKRKGAEIYLETPLTKAKRVGSSWQVETPKGIFEAEYLENAAGAWAGEVARRAGLTKFSRTKTSGRQ